MNYCIKCGGGLSQDDKFCQFCGSPVSNEVENETPNTAHQQNYPTYPNTIQQNQPIQQPDQQYYQKQKQKSGNGKTFIIIGILLFLFMILIAGGIAGYFLFIKETKNVEKVQIEEDKKESKTQTKEEEKTVTSYDEEKKTTETQKEGFIKREKRTGDCGDYPELSERKLSPEELVGVSDKDKKYMENDIYMRHGYIFTDEDLLLHFAMFSCYKPKHLNVNRFLTDIEKYNIKLLK